MDTSLLLSHNQLISACQTREVTATSNTLLALAYVQNTLLYCTDDSPWQALSRSSTHQGHVWCQREDRNASSYHTPSQLAPLAKGIIK